MTRLYQLTLTEDELKMILLGNAAAAAVVADHCGAADALRDVTNVIVTGWESAPTMSLLAKVKAVRA